MSEPDAAEMSTIESDPPSVADPPENWMKDDLVDEMRGTTTRRAVATSENRVELESPYGRVGAALMVRERPEEGLAILLIADDGQILCQPHRGDTVAVKFDASSIKTFPCSRTSDGSSEVIFIDSEDQFLRQLRASDKLMIEVEFYRAGSRQFKFDVAGLGEVF